MRIAYVPVWYPPARLTGSEYYLKWIAERVPPPHRSLVLTTNVADYARRRTGPRSSSGPATRAVVDGIPVERFPVARWTSRLVGELRDLSRPWWETVVWPLGPLGDWLDVVARGFYAPGLLRRLQAEDVDLLHTAGVPHPTNWWASRAAEASGSPHVITPFINAGFPEEYRPPWVWRVLRKARAVVAVTPWEAAFLEKRGVPTDRIRVVPAGIDVDEWREADGAGLREEAGLDPEAFVVLVPRKNVLKGTLDVLDALLRIASQMEPVAVLALDDWPLPGYNERVERLERAGIRVVDLGYVDGQRKRDAFDACDVLAQPSRVEAFGLVYLEAWARGKPVLASRVGAVPDVVQDGVNGFLVPHGDIDAIAERLQILREDPVLARRLGRQGRNDLKAHYRLEGIVERLVEIYEAVA